MAWHGDGMGVLSRVPDRPPAAFPNRRLRLWGEHEAGSGGRDVDRMHGSRYAHALAASTRRRGHVALHAPLLHPRAQAVSKAMSRMAGAGLSDGPSAAPGRIVKVPRQQQHRTASCRPRAKTQGEGTKRAVSRLGEVWSSPISASTAHALLLAAAQASGILPFPAET